MTTTDGLSAYRRRLVGQTATMNASRRRLLSAAGTLPLLALGRWTPARGATRKGKVVVIGGGYGGATAARYAALWGGDAVDVTLVERDEAFVSCPLSNLVLGGSKTMADITIPYQALARRGVNVVRDAATAVDVDRRRVRLARGPELAYDRLILSPGIDFFFDRVNGLDTEVARATFLHAWQAGPQTLALRRQIESMRDGGVFAISIPRAPYRCPPGPYERACQVAWYFQRAKPRSKVLVLDGNEDVQSKKALFTKAWSEDYKGIVEYRPDYVLTDVDVSTRTARFETADDVKADVLNVIPPHGAGADRPQCERHHRQQSVVRGRLPDVRVAQRAGYSRARRRDPGRAADAEVGAHGEPARQDRGGRGAGSTCGAAGESDAGREQHLLQLHQRPRSGARHIRASIRCEAENVLDRPGLRRPVDSKKRRRRKLRIRVGAIDLGRHAGVSPNHHRQGPTP